MTDHPKDWAEAYTQGQDPLAAADQAWAEHTRKKQFTIGDKLADSNQGSFDNSEIEALKRFTKINEKALRNGAQQHEAPVPDHHVRAEPSPRTEPLEFINVTAWDDQPVPERKWVTLNRIPDEEVTLLSGEGCVGKSTILKQLAVATVIGRDWLGTMPGPGPVIYITAEEKPDELHYRLHHIARHYGVRLADLGDFHPRSLKGEDAVLAHPDRNGIIQPTRLYERLFLSVQNVKPRWVGIDPSACVYAGKESDRAQVQQFVNLLARIALHCHCAVILVSHPSLTGINTGTGLSGTTQWHNAVRSRLYLKRATTAQGDEPDPDLRELEVMKQNYGPVGERVRLRWRDGVFVSERSAVGTLERMAQDQKADNTFLALLKRFAEQGQDVNHKFGPSYAPARFAKHPDAGGINRSGLASAMQRLLDAGKVKIERGGRPSRPTYRLVLT
jgi:RecA-family ATPase